MRQPRTRARNLCNTEQNSAFCSGTSVDRRIRKTQHDLREALASLIAEKPYDSIVIKEILERANVGRSTFYTHFRDKDDLLVSSIHAMVGSGASQKSRESTVSHEQILWFSRPIFEYHYAHRHDGQFAVRCRGRDTEHERLGQVLAVMMSDALKGVEAMPADIVAQYVSSTFVLVLDWWLQSADPLPPEQVDRLFRSLVVPVLSGLIPS